VTFMKERKEAMSKQEREMKKAMGKMNMGDMLKAAEQNEFRMIATIGYLNKLAMILSDDHPLLALSSVNEMNLTDEQFAHLTDNHIVYHDAARTESDDSDEVSFPVVAKINGRGEDGKLNIEYADTAFGGTQTHFRLVIVPDLDSGREDVFVTVFCEGIDKNIIVTDEQWYCA